MNKDAHSLIEEFALRYKGTDTKEFSDKFREFCLDNEITKEDFEEYKENFRMFLYENPTFSYNGGIGWQRQYLLDNYNF